MGIVKELLSCFKKTPAARQETPAADNMDMLINGLISTYSNRPKIDNSDRATTGNSNNPGAIDVTWGSPEAIAVVTIMQLSRGDVLAPENHESLNPRPQKTPNYNIALQRCVEKLLPMNTDARNTALETFSTISKNPGEYPAAVLKRLSSISPFKARAKADAIELGQNIGKMLKDSISNSTTLTDQNARENLEQLNRLNNRRKIGGEKSDIGETLYNLARGEIVESLNNLPISILNTLQENTRNAANQGNIPILIAGIVSNVRDAEAQEVFSTNFTGREAERQSSAPSSSVYR